MIQLWIMNEWEICQISAGKLRKGEIDYIRNNKSLKRSQIDLVQLAKIFTIKNIQVLVYYGRSFLKECMS